MIEKDPKFQTMQDFNDLTLDIPLDDVSDRFSRLESQRTIDKEVIRSRGQTPSKLRNKSKVQEPLVVYDEKNVLKGDIEPDMLKKFLNLTNQSKTQDTVL